MKKILTALILSCLLLQSFALTSCSNNNEATTVVQTMETTEKKLDYEDDNGVGYELLPDGTLTVSQCSSKSEIIIPEEYKGKKVTTIGKKAFRKSTATSITLPKTITTIEDFAFGLCTDLKELNINEGVTRIGANAFIGCFSLKKLKLPQSLKTIDIFAFDGCGLTEIEIPKNVELIDQYAFAECNKLQKIVFKGNDVVISENVFNRTNKVIVYGDKNSTAIKYAKQYGIKYKEI